MISAAWELRQRLWLSIIFIAHDLRVAAQICDLVAVMKDGAVVEHGRGRCSIRLQAAHSREHATAV